MKVEQRYFENGTEFRAHTDDDGNKFIEGHAAVTNSRSRLLSNFGEVFFEEIEKGAFENVLESAEDTIFVRDHDPAQIMARTESGTLELKEDDKGLFFRASIPDTQLANDTYTLIERGDLRENSFAFTIDSDGYRWSETDEGVPLRIISKIQHLRDVSTVTRGAYAETEVFARGLQEYIDEHKEEEVAPTKVDDTKLKARLIKLKNKNY